MSTFVYYQAVPYDAKLLSLAAGTADAPPELISLAGDALFSSLLGAHVDHPGFLEAKYPALRELFKEYSTRAEWNFSSHPFKVARAYKLMAALDPQADWTQKGFSPEEQEQTLGYRMVFGCAPFSAYYSHQTGGKTRISSPEFVSDCAIYCQVTDRDSITESAVDYFDGLKNFYQTVASEKTLAVLVMEN